MLGVLRHAKMMSLSTWPCHRQWLPSTYWTVARLHANSSRWAAEPWLAGGKKGPRWRWELPLSTRQLPGAVYVHEAALGAQWSRARDKNSRSGRVGKKRCMAECEQTGEGREEWTVSPPYVPLLLCRQGSNLPCARPPAVLPTPVTYGTIVAIVAWVRAMMKLKVSCTFKILKGT